MYIYLFRKKHVAEISSGTSNYLIGSYYVWNFVFIWVKKKKF